MVYYVNLNMRERGGSAPLLLFSASVRLFPQRGDGWNRPLLSFSGCYFSGKICASTLYPSSDIAGARVVRRGA